ncbi:MAG: glycosyltransferase family 4 protein [Burkholderiales bacterium]
MGDQAGRLRVLVPRLFDAGNTNAQNLNAKALLARFRRPEVTWYGLNYGPPDQAVAANPQVRLARLWRRHLWPWHAVWQYQRDVDAIFYPGAEWFDEAGLRWRSRLGRRVPVIATLEGLAGDADTERRLSEVAGHEVHCHRVEQRILKRTRAMLDRADHVIAISPFLARMGRILHGDKFSVLPLGVDTATFHPRARPASARRITVAFAGRLGIRKRPRIALDLAARWPHVAFRWYGDGDERAGLVAEAGKRGLSNVEFAGARSPAQLAEALRDADVFVLPSLSEGVPKVTLEAAACGLPVVAFGFYEPPSVLDGKSGCLVWSDRELEVRLGELIESEPLRRELGAAGLALAQSCDWDDVAGRWEQHLVELAHGGAA